MKDTTVGYWRKVLRINLDSVYFPWHASLQHFCKQNGGRIVNISSGGGFQGMDTAHACATAKSGIINLTRSLAKAYGQYGVSSNAIAPGFIDTDMVSSVFDSELDPFASENTRYQASPLGRPGTPEEIADAI